MNHQLDCFVSVSRCVFLGRVKTSAVASREAETGHRSPSHLGTCNVHVH